MKAHLRTKAEVSPRPPSLRFHDEKFVPSPCEPEPLGAIGLDGRRVTAKMSRLLVRSLGRSALVAYRVPRQRRAL